MTEANYDDAAALVRVKTKAQAVIVMVIDGKRGSGWAVNVRGAQLTEADKEQLFLDVVRSRQSAAMQKDLGVAPRNVAPAEGERCAAAAASPRLKRRR
jgi:hypothetical protein